MNTFCESCKHWDKKEPDPYGSDPQASLGLGRCRKVEMFWDATEWNEEGDGRQFIQPIETKAFVQDGSDFAAYLYTMPDFGCVQHESK